MTQEVLDFIRTNEGWNPRPYLLRGIWHIGWGYNLEANGMPGHIVKRVLARQPITAEQGDRLLLDILGQCLGWALRIFPGFKSYALARQTVILDLIYNMGPGDAQERTGFQGFAETIKAIRAEDWERAATQLLQSRYARQLPERAKRNAMILRAGVFAS